MGKAKWGDTVRIHYVGKLKSGVVFDSSRDREPAEFSIGSEDILPLIEEGVIGMGVGDVKTIEIPPDDAYGPVCDELVFDIARSDFPKHLDPCIGEQMKVQDQSGELIDVVILEYSKKKVTLDANHPLAGRTLFFDVELIDIAD